MLEINKIYNEDCLITMSKMGDNSIDLVITSPPYYNARDYSQWDSLDDYYNDMRTTFESVFRIIKNHKYFILVCFLLYDCNLYFVSFYMSNI